MLFVDIIESEIYFKPLTRDDSRTYWEERRRWWCAHKAETGCDWAGINRSQIEIACFSAAVRRRGAA
jgi:hypothetical protein